MLLCFINNSIAREFSIENNFLQYVEDISPLSFRVQSCLTRTQILTDIFLAGQGGEHSVCIMILVLRFNKMCQSTFVLPYDIFSSEDTSFSHETVHVINYYLLVFYLFLLFLENMFIEVDLLELIFYVSLLSMLSLFSHV